MITRELLARWLGVPAKHVLSINVTQQHENIYEFGYSTPISKVAVGPQRAEAKVFGDLYSNQRLTGNLLGPSWVVESVGISYERGNSFTNLVLVEANTYAYDLNDFWVPENWLRVGLCSTSS